MASRKPASPRLIPIGPTDMLSTEQKRRVQALWVARRVLPSGDLKAHNLQMMADYIMAAGADHAVQE